MSNVMMSIRLGPKAEIEMKNYADDVPVIWITDGPMHLILALEHGAAERLCEVAKKAAEYQQ